MPLMVFIPTTDEMGNPIETSLAMKLVVGATGLMCFFFAIYLCVPGIFRKRTNAPEKI